MIEQQTRAINLDRVARDFYRIESFTRPGTWYDLRWSAQYARWYCSCPDAQGQRFNANCKHKVTFLQWIAERKRIRAQAAAIAHGVAQDMEGAASARAPRPLHESDDMRAARRLHLRREARAYLARVTRLHVADCRARELADQAGYASYCAGRNAR